MKEVKAWDNHQREMWLWDDDFSRKRKLLVIYIIEGEKDCTYPVIAFDKDTADVESFKHCAEIEPARRMTCKEFSRWLRKKPNREYKFQDGDLVYNSYNYYCTEQYDEIPKCILVREGDENWHALEVEE